MISILTTGHCNWCRRLFPSRSKPLQYFQLSHCNWSCYPKLTMDSLLRNLIFTLSSWKVTVRMWLMPSKITPLMKTGGWPLLYIQVFHRRKRAFQRIFWHWKSFLTKVKIITLRFNPTEFWFLVLSLLISIWLWLYELMGWDGCQIASTWR